ncbi:hypothetical protein [Spiroplasma ixodetis]|uniref:Uncharacterized protein n=1 Tax=Spiroplasma ixodetis TaxID=2141 RepID=A0ABM8BSB5_9MOLU|nr:hypothetical protein [Spiroplasma ixodetis]BDT02743.1 hypothetical protein SHM_03890 [Spiroplasma ixodetis]
MNKCLPKNSPKKGCHSINFQTQLNFEIDKPLSFYIEGFMFYFEYEYFKTFTANFVFSFLDNVGDTKYVFKGKVDNDIYQQDLYNFVTMPIRVPNLRTCLESFRK